MSVNIEKERTRQNITINTIKVIINELDTIADLARDIDKIVPQDFGNTKRKTGIILGKATSLKIY